MTMLSGAGTTGQGAAAGRGSEIGERDIHDQQRTRPPPMGQGLTGVQRKLANEARPGKLPHDVAVPGNLLVAPADHGNQQIDHEDKYEELGEKTKRPGVSGAVCVETLLGTRARPRSAAPCTGQT